MAQVLDLRKKPKKNYEKDILKKSSQSEVLPSVLSSKKPTPKISWEAPSFYFNPQKKYFALTVIALASGGGAMFFFRQDNLMAIFLILSSLVLILYSNKRPEISKITVNQTGVAIGNALYYYKDLRSFWIHYNPGGMKELSIESKKWYMPYVRVSIEGKNPLIIRSLLVNFLAEKEHENSLVDIISRKIGL